MPTPDKAELIEQMLARERYEKEHGSVSAEMPRYKCHKEVWALKIADVIDPTKPGNESDGSRLLTVADKGFDTIRVPADYVRKHNPQPGGYYVVYKDGYKSFSPADVFEDGYTKV
jgi:hypothetical protein